MPKFVYTGPYTMDVLYPNAFTVQPGDTVEADENPDKQWFKSAGTKAAKEAKDQAEAAQTEPADETRTDKED